MAAAKDIYCKVRRGEMLPVEDWTAKQVEAKPEPKAPDKKKTENMPAGRWEFHCLRRREGTNFSLPFYLTLTASTIEEAKVRCSLEWQTVNKVNPGTAHSPSLVFVYEHDFESLNEAEVDRLLDAHGKSAPSE